MITLETTHSDLVKWFQLEFPELVQSMKDASHHYDDQNLNPYHLEGDVWTHTNMVYQNSLHFSPSNPWVKFSTLFHDIGKPTAREVVDERKRVRFIGHEGLSAFMVVDVLNKTNLSTEDKLRVFKLVAKHGDLFHFVKADGTIKEDLVDTFKGEREFLMDLAHQVRADSLGRWYEPEALSNALFTRNLPNEVKPFADRVKDVEPMAEGVPTLTVLVGPPCSRKSTWVAANTNENTVVISRDALVEAAGEKRGMNYGEAFKFLMDNNDVSKREVDEVMNKQVQTTRNDNKSVIIDMTSMSKKARRRWVNEFTKYNKRVVMFVSGYQDLLECNKKREEETGKTIKPFVVDNMCKSFSLPMASEGFNLVEYVWNE
jgi:predicted kinase